MQKTHTIRQLVRRSRCEHTKKTRKDDEQCVLYVPLRQSNYDCDDIWCVWFASTPIQTGSQWDTTSSSISHRKNAHNRNSLIFFVEFVGFCKIYYNNAMALYMNNKGLMYSKIANKIKSTFLNCTHRTHPRAWFFNDNTIACVLQKVICLNIYWKQYAPICSVQQYLQST